MKHTFYFLTFCTLMTSTLFPFIYISTSWSQSHILPIHLICYSHYVCSSVSLWSPLHWSFNSHLISSSVPSWPWGKFPRLLLSKSLTFSVLLSSLMPGKLLILQISNRQAFSISIHGLMGATPKSWCCYEFILWQRCLKCIHFLS